MPFSSDVSTQVIAPDQDPAIVMEVGVGVGTGTGLVLNTWKSYSYNSHFLTPTDGWSFTLGDESIMNTLREAIAPRQKVTLSINGDVQCTGYIDTLTINTSRSGGLEMVIQGRDSLSSAVDACIDPRLKFTPEMSLLDVLRKALGPFGFGAPEQFVADNEANRNIMSGHARGRSTSKKGKPLKSFALHLLKPQDHETAFDFAKRVANRFGLWIWCSADGNSIIVGKPDFDVRPAYKVRHKRDEAGGDNSILTATLVLDGSSQPSIIFASGFGTGGENPRDQFTLAVVNPAMFVGESTSLQDILHAYPKTRLITQPTVAALFVDRWARPLFLRDEDSKTQDELENYLRRELALRLHKAFTYTFEVEGHEYIDPDGTRVPWAIDSLVTVDDDVNNVHEDLYILSRTFTKSRAGGTKTKLECIRPHTLEF